MEKKRERQPNWTAKEELAYVAGYAERLDILEGEFSGGGLGGSGISHLTKEQAWLALQAEVNSVSVFHRKLDYIKKKWAQLKCSALKKNRGNLTLTGGGRGAFLTEAESLVLDILRGKNSSTISGVSAGADIFSVGEASEHNCVLPAFPEAEEDNFEKEYPLEGQVLIQELIDQNAEFPLVNVNEIKEIQGPDSVKDKPARTPKGKKRSLTLNDEWMKEEISLIQLKKKKIELEIKILEYKVRQVEE